MWLTETLREKTYWDKKGYLYDKRSVQYVRLQSHYNSIVHDFREFSI